MEYVVISESKPCVVSTIGGRSCCKYYRLSNKFRRFCVVNLLRLFGSEYRPNY